MTSTHPHPTRRAVLGGAALAAVAVTAGAGIANATASAAWPTEFPLPDGWLPEGITIGSKP
jgi:nitrous oxide reductase